MSADGPSMVATAAADLPPRDAVAFWPLAAREVARLTGGELVGDAAATAERVSTDSRAGVRPGDLFVGLQGPHFDGSRFVPQALAEGATIALLAPEHAPALAGTGQALVVVPDPLLALQSLAAEARRRFTGAVVAITGSHGKTTVKDMLVAALGGERRVAASPLSYNSQVGVALSLLQLDPAAEVAVVECGVSLPGEMERLAAMVRPDCGVLTGIGDAHLAGLGSREVTAREKARLFAGLSRGPAGPRRGAEARLAAVPTGLAPWVLALARDELGRRALGEQGAPLLLVGDGGGPVESPSPSPGPVQPDAAFALERSAEAVVLRWPAGGASLRLAPSGGGSALSGAPPHLIEDAALAAAAALLLGASPAAIEAGLAAWTPAPMRLEMATTPRGILLLNDAYTADPVSMEAALSALRRERRGGAAVAVLGGMAQLGVARAAAHRRVGERVATLGVDRLVGVGEGGAEIAAAALAAGMPAERVHAVPGVAEAAMVLEEHCRPGDRVLLKASRPERLERIAAMLFDAVAPARLYVDLDAVVDNFRALRRAAGRGGGVMAVVKSWGYGLDSVRVTRSLERAGADYFAVAYPDEGVLLRDHGVTAPVLVQNVLAHEVEKLVRHGLAAQVSSAEQAGWIAREAERQQRAVRVHLKVDTGMGRAGAFVEDAVAVAGTVQASPWLLLEGLLTHFAAADDPAHDAFTREQIRRFETARAALAAAGFRFRWEHAAASAAIARFPEARYSMVRAGLALFGYAEGGGEGALPQTPALRLTTQVVSVKELPAGHAVGYGRTFADARRRRIAVVALGYSDGYPWALSNRGWMLVAGHRCPVVGRVSMDVTTLDVSEAGEVQPGDEVVVFGAGPGEPSLLELARLAGTIPYELLTRISPRVRRIFQTSV